MQPVDLPLVSVIIVNYNGYQFTSRCLEAVFKADYPNYEVILVDNGSTDGTVEKIERDFGKHVKIIALEKNHGPSSARNRAMSIAKGTFIATLDNDTEPDPKWLKQGITRMVGDSHLGVIQCRLMLLRQPDCFDYVGDYLGSFGFLVQPVHGGERDVGQASEEAVILSAKSAGMIFRREAFERVGGFDEDYFIYVEETDLCLRMWLVGYTALYCPTSVVYHEFGSSQIALGETHTRFGRYHGAKNYVATLLKSLETTTLIRMLPIHIFLWMAWATLNLMRGRHRSAFWITEGLLWNVMNFKKTMRKRKIIQAQRVISDADLLKIVGRPNSVGSMLGKTKSMETSLGNYKAHRV